MGPYIFEKTKKVGGEEKSGFDETVPAGEKKLREEVITVEPEKYREEAQKMLDAFRRNFITYARDVSLTFKMSDRFQIDYETGEVHLNARWFAKKHMTHEQIRWAILHELTHFVDFSEDRAAMMGNFDYVFQRAKKTGEIILKKYEKKFGVSDSKRIEAMRKQNPVSARNPSKTMNAAEATAYKIHHTFFNVFDDIYVNRRLERRAPAYAPEMRGGGEVKRLYREELFQGRDYSKDPRHLQFINALLRSEMIPDEEITISDDVRWVLEDMPIRFRGKSYTARQIIEKFIKPRSARKTNAGERYDILRQTLEPIFDSLLLKDFDEWDPQEPESEQQKDEENAGEGESQKKGEGESKEERKEESEEPQGGQKEGGGEGEKQESSPFDINPFGKSYREFEENSPDQMSEEDIRAWAEAEEKKEGEQKKETLRPQKNKEREGEEQNKEQEERDKRWSEKEGIDYRAVEEFRKIEQEVAQYKKELSRLWQKIVYGSSRGMETGVSGHFPTGTEPDIEKVIEEWPRIQKGGGGQAEIMLRMTETEKEIEKPELIRLRIIGDMSGSMQDGEKIHILQQCMVLLLSSFHEFQGYLNLTRRATKTKLEVDSEAWVFGDSAYRIKRFRKEAGANQEQKELIAILHYLQKNSTIGNTYDHFPLSKIERSLTPDEEKKIGKKRILEIVFEITDGGSSNPDATRQNVHQLSEKGVILRAFQIGNTSPRERGVFDYVWNTGDEKRGEIVGTDIANLIPAVVQALKKYLSGVKI